MKRILLLLFSLTIFGATAQNVPFSTVKAKINSVLKEQAGYKVDVNDLNDMNTQMLYSIVNLKQYQSAFTYKQGDPAVYDG